MGYLPTFSAVAVFFVSLVVVVVVVMVVVLLFFRARLRWRDMATVALFAMALFALNVRLNLGWRAGLLWSLVGTNLAHVLTTLADLNSHATKILLVDRQLDRVAQHSAEANSRSRVG